MALRPSDPPAVAGASPCLDDLDSEVPPRSWRSPYAASGKTRDLLHILGYDHQIATKGKPSPIQVGKRWVVERTHSWMNGFGKLRRNTDKKRTIVEFYLFLAAAITVLRRLINTARTHYRWDTRPITRRLP